MDQAAGTGPQIPVPDEAGRIEGFVQGTGRLVVLLGSPRAGRAALDRILEELPGHAVRVGNALASPLTLHRLLFQLGAELDDGDDAASLLRCLQDRAGTGGLAVLAVEDAHTLAPDAMTALLQVPCAAAGDRPGRLLILAGHTDLLDKLPRASDPAHTLLLHLEGEAAPAAAQAVQAGPAPVRRIGPRAKRLVLVAGVLGACILLLLAFGPSKMAPGPAPQAAGAVPVEAPAAAPAAPAIPVPDPVPPSPAPFTPALPTPALPTPTLPVPALPMPALPRATPLPRPAAAPSDADLRREFDVFLDRAGRDTAGLSPASRAALFREYLEWRGGPAGRDPQR